MVFRLYWFTKLSACAWPDGVNGVANINRPKAKEDHNDNSHLMEVILRFWAKDRYSTFKVKFLV
jgi:hypothetical protein